jgi:hypothetical protein
VLFPASLCRRRAILLLCRAAVHMPYSREQLILGAREAAQGLVDRLGRGDLVARFVDGYVTAYHRRGLKDSPLRYKELLSTIMREALLSAVARLFELLPAAITGRKKALLKGSEAEAVETFREAFLNCLAEQMRWLPSDREAFRDDVELYARLAVRLPKNPNARKAAYPTEGPFVDRCALLLDPSLLDKARQSAGKFQKELESAAEEILWATFKKKRKR